MFTGACKQCHRPLVEHDSTRAGLCLDCGEAGLPVPPEGAASEVELDIQTGSDLFLLALDLAEIDDSPTGPAALGRWQVVVANAQRHDQDESSQD